MNHQGRRGETTAVAVQLRKWGSEEWGNFGDLIFKKTGISGRGDMLVC